MLRDGDEASAKRIILSNLHWLGLISNWKRIMNYPVRGMMQEAEGSIQSRILTVYS